MSERKEVVVESEAGFLEVSITLDAAIPLESLGFMRTQVQVYGEDSFLQTVPIKIDSTEIIVVKPGRLTVSAVLGGLFSESTEIEVHPGELVKVKFVFGKKKP